MHLIRGLQNNNSFSNGCVAAIGNFDGVHQGHQALIVTLVNESMRLGVPSVVFLFEPQPAEYFNLNNPPARLTTLRDKVGHLKKLGVKFICMLKFNHNLAGLPAEKFVQTLLSADLNIQSLFVGEDFRFGKNRQGDKELLSVLFNKDNRHVEVFPDHLFNGQRVSSTLIRKALANSDLHTAAQLLGRDYSMCRRVVRGDGRGRQWGIPTANFAMSQKTLPLRGVFSVLAVRHGTEIIQGVANIGCRPTVDGLKNILEVHLHDFNQSIYGEFVEIIFLKKIRDEEKFASINQLIARIKQDIEISKNHFKNRLLIEGKPEVKALLTNRI